MKTYTILWLTISAFVLGYILSMLTPVKSIQMACYAPVVRMCVAK